MAHIRIDGIVHGVIADKGDARKAFVQSREAVCKAHAQRNIAAFVEQIVVQVEAAVVVVPHDYLLSTGGKQAARCRVGFAGGLQLGKL